MFTEINVENYKSIASLKLELGRINVFIGENGAGKSNILEVIALAGASAAEKLDNEFLASRGIRVTRPEYMRGAFPDRDIDAPIDISICMLPNLTAHFTLQNDNAPYSKWSSSLVTSAFDFDYPKFTESVDHLVKKDTRPDNIKAEDVKAFLGEILKSLKSWSDENNLSGDSPIEGKTEEIFRLPNNPLTQKFTEVLSRKTLNGTEFFQALSNFVIYSPENSALRKFERDGQIEPLGINGEGVLKLLAFYSAEAGQETLTKIKSSLKLLDWFDDFDTLSVSSDAQLLVTDRHLDKDVTDYDHKSTNEGFFFLLFYFLLFTSKLTPKFFAVDNIDASLNPKLCEKLIRELTLLSKENDKQVILTTHNPATLDGLDLNDDDQRLFVISRGRSGSTRVTRIRKPKAEVGTKPPRLSELFMRGLIGGLPKGF